LYPSGISVSLIGVFAVCAGTSWTKIEDIPAALGIFVRGCSLVCGAYAVLLFPDFPAPAHDLRGWAQPVLVLAWSVAGLSAVAAFWRPTWLLFTSFYIIWVKLFAGYATGFRFHTILDILPLYQAPAIVALSIAALAIACRLRPSPTSYLKIYRDLIGNLLVIAAIAMQAANYFYSGTAKMSLEGPSFYWVLNNNVGSLLRVALYEKQLLWGEVAGVTTVVDQMLSYLGRPMAFAILGAQLAAVLMFINNRLLIGLFIVFDLVHLGIFAVVGANFWTWLTFNLAPQPGRKGTDILSRTRETALEISETPHPTMRLSAARRCGLRHQAQPLPQGPDWGRAEAPQGIGHNA
jgi:hypothetical protein